MDAVEVVLIHGRNGLLSGELVEALGCGLCLVTCVARLLHHHETRDVIVRGSKIPLMLAELLAHQSERLAAEGEICWGGMHSWKHMVNLLEAVGMPKVVGFQADMSHTHLYTLGANAEAHRIVPKNYHYEPAEFHKAMTKLTDALRPWTIDFHVAQNDGSTYGSGSHEKTGRHCLATDPKGKLNIARDSGYWLRDGKGKVTKKMKHICWDGCMFSNEVLMKQQTWNDILAAMIEVRTNHGWVG